MIEIITKVIGLIFIIFLGYAFKKVGIFRIEDSKIISKIILNVTLPALLITSFQNITISYALLSAVIMGVIFNIIAGFLGKFVSRKEEPKTRALYILNCPGYNVGGFTIPVVQTFLEPISFVAICMYDIGNSIMTLGGNYAIASNELDTDNKLKSNELIKKMLSSVALDTYLIMFLFSLLNVKMPQPIISIASTIGGANAFLGMFMIGLAFEINLDSSSFKMVRGIIITRYCASIVLSLIVYFVLPFPLLIRQALAIVVFSPVSGVSVAYTEKCGCDIRISGLASSISIPISMMFMTILIILMT